MRVVGLGGTDPNYFFGKAHGRSRRPASKTSATSQSAASSSPSGLNRAVNAGLISGSMSLAGDLLAQILASRNAQLGESRSYDLARSARMGSFGLFLYGPGQHWWYGMLDSRFPLKTASHFFSKVALNQLLLGPVVLLVVFSWNLALQRQPSLIPNKIKRDFKPTMINGWKFWVPAACVNFWLIPLENQVLYMSLCGVLWTGYLSFSSNKA